MTTMNTKLDLLKISVKMKKFKVFQVTKTTPNKVKKTILTVTSRVSKTALSYFDMNATYFSTNLDMENDFIFVQIKLEYLVGQ
jgi:hypothetical protein